MELLAQRLDANNKRTLGQLFIDRWFECYTLEDPIQHGPKVPGFTAIPAGRYRIELRFSPHFNAIVPCLIDVPGFTDIEIHWGNTTKDTSGCLLLGQMRFADSVGRSIAAVQALMIRLSPADEKGEPIWITVTDPPLPNVIAA